MLLKSLYGDLPRVDYVLFADTGDEPREVYQHVARLKAECARHDMPFHQVSAGRLSDVIWSDKPEARFMAPFFRNRDGVKEQGKRQCTAHHKLRPIYRFLRDRGHTAKNPVALWIGITVDEAHRMRTARVQYVSNTYPLVDARLNRGDCANYLDRLGWSTVKSACYYCPLHSNSQWRQLKSDPEEWARVVEFDRKLRSRQEFLHQTCRPIEDIPLTDEDVGQLSLFGTECEGHCGR